LWFVKDYVIDTKLKNHMIRRADMNRDKSVAPHAVYF